jgi:predicted aspartyl protease
MRHPVATVLLALSLVPAIAHADEPLPAAATIRANILAASALPPSYRQTTTTTSTDVRVITQRIVRGGEWRLIVDRPLLHSESGVFKNRAWHLNDNGLAVVDTILPDTPKAVTAASVEAQPGSGGWIVTRIHAPIDGYLLASVGSFGFGMKQYIDRATWRIMRTETTGPSGTITVVYDDFREDGGRVFAHHWSTTDFAGNKYSDAQITAYDASPVTDAEIGMPENRSLVQFPEGAQSVDLPTQFLDESVYVRVVINGRGLDFALDTGAASIAIDKDTADELKLTLTKVPTGARAIVSEMHIGKLTMRDVSVHVVPSIPSGDSRVKTVGLLGYDFLAGLGVTIDYQHRRVSVVPEAAYAAPLAADHLIPLDVRVLDGVPNVDVTINGVLADRFSIDTGGTGSIMINNSFARKHPEALVDKGGGGNLRRMTFTGVGGNLRTVPVQLGSVRIGPFNLVNFLSYLITSESIYMGGDGTIGPDFLRLFTLGIDYGKNRVYLVPNDLGRSAMGLDQTPSK